MLHTIIQRTNPSFKIRVTQKLIGKSTLTSCAEEGDLNILLIILKSFKYLDFL